MRETIALIIGLVCGCSLSAHAGEEAKTRPLMPDASMQEIQKQIQASGRPATSVMPIFSQIVAFTLPKGFSPAFSNAEGDGYIFEAVPQGETAQKWSQMVTVTGAQGLAVASNASPQVFLTKFAELFKTACPATFSIGEVGASKVSGHDAFTTLIGCGTARSPGNVRSEAAAVLAVKGSEDFYTFQWAERGPARNKPIDLNDAKWQDRLAKLGPIRICAPVAGEGPPYPSCLAQK
jgi:hypothetical protein